MGLGLMMLMSAGIEAHAQLFIYPFAFVLRARGDSDESAPEKKTLNTSCACISINECVNTSQHPLWFRVRAQEGNAYATDVKQLNGTGLFFPDYINGHGVVDKQYYIKMQTDSLSEVGATARGSWRP